jgi:uncharacterized protein (DUF1330 family)
LGGIIANSLSLQIRNVLDPHKELDMNAKSLPAYLIGKLRIKDSEDYMNRYGLPVLTLLEAAGAEILAVSPEPEILEGEWDSNWTVIIKFPSVSAAKQFYASGEYAPYLSLRMNELTERGSLALLEGFDPAALGL